ncbi:MAG TPA: protein kinase [Planctomycetota bacterium]|nr:protein kinase [Planctomycetota bacterium]
MEGDPDRTKSQKDIMSVCLAVVRGVLTSDQARAAILGRTEPVPVNETLRLPPEILRQAESLGQLPAREQEECLAMFKELYEQPSPAEILDQDQALSRTLVDQRLISPGQAEECLAIQKRLADARAHPLPRLGELLLRKGFLTPGILSASVTVRLPTRPGSGALESRIRKDLESGLPPEVRGFLTDPSNRFARYLRTQLLGKGGAGEVWKAWDMELGRWVALKFLKFEDIEELDRLKREAQTSAKLSHPHIAAVYEIAEAREKTFLVMQYVDGQTLETFPRDNREKLVTIVREVALAIHYAHSRGVIHRDLKPGNIMVDTSGRPFVMDFGLARQIESKRSISGIVLGTPAYMPPEQAVGAPADVRSDVYSLGATLYELLANRPPFRGESVLEILKKVTQEEPTPLAQAPEELRTVVAKCLMKEPSLRYASAWDLAEDLRRWGEGEPILAHPPSVAYRLRKLILKRRAILGVALGGLLLASLVAALLVPRWLSKERELRVERENEARTQKSLDQARPLLDEGRRILERLDRVLMTDDGSPETVRGLAQEAQHQFDRALEIAPGFPDTLLEKARAYQAEGNPEAAMEFCSRAIEASRQFGTAYLQRSRLLLDRYEKLRHSSGPQARQETQAEQSLATRIREDLQEVEAWSKDNQERLFAKGAMAFVNSDYELAARSLQAYSQLVVSDYRGWAWAGHAWLHVPEKEEEAIRALSEAIKYRPRLASIRVFRGFAYLHQAENRKRQGNLRPFVEARDLAAQDFTRATLLDPGSWESRLGMGDAFRDQGEGASAIREYSQAIKLNPGASVAYLRRASLELATGDLEAGSADAEQAVRLHPEDPAGLLSRAALRDAAGDFDRALSDIEGVLEKVPDSAEAYLRRGTIKRHRGDTPGARKDDSRAAQLKPEWAAVYLEQARCWRFEGDLQACLTSLDHALTIDRGDPDLYYDRSLAQLQVGTLDRAAADLRRGLELSPFHPEKFHLRLWLVRMRQNDHARASEELILSSGTPPEKTSTELYPILATFLRGPMREEEFRNLLENNHFSKSDQCVGYYYAAEKAILEGRKEAGMDLFRRCLATRAILEDEYESARQELDRIGKQ